MADRSAVRRVGRAWIAACLSVVALDAGAASPLTQKCNTNFGDGIIVALFRSPTVMNEFMAIAADSTKDPDIYQRLWQPNGGQAGYADSGRLSYDWIQDTGEIAAALAADPVLKSRGLDSVYADNTGGACFPELPPVPSITVTEYHNRLLDHYFLSSSDAENQAIDQGAAGPGWERTGESFSTIASNGCYGAYPVFRFYGAGPHSHFFTVDPAECGFVRNHDPGWQFEGNAFGAIPPNGGACPPRSTPVYRLYNNRWMFDDSNHRYVTRTDLYQAMQAQGWVGEGVAFCTIPAQ